MKIVLIPLLAATALLGGCHHATVRHTVEVPVAVTEHRHVDGEVVIVHRHEVGNDGHHHHENYPPTPPHSVHNSVTYREVHVYPDGSHRAHEEERHPPRHERVIVTPVPPPRREGRFGHAARDSLERAENRAKQHRDHATLPGNREYQNRHHSGDDREVSRDEGRFSRESREHHDNARVHRMPQPVPVMRPERSQQAHRSWPDNQGHLSGANRNHREGNTHSRPDHTLRQAQSHHERRPDPSAHSQTHSPAAKPVRDGKAKREKPSPSEAKRRHEHGKEKQEEEEARHENHWRDK